MQHLILYEMPAFIQQNKEFIVEMIIGALAAYIAQFILPGRGFGLLATIIIGIAGGIVGGILFGKFIHFFHDAIFNEILCAILGSIIIIVILNLILGTPKTGSEERDVYDWENE